MDISADQNRKPSLQELLESRHSTKISATEGRTSQILPQSDGGAGNMVLLCFCLETDLKKSNQSKLAKYIEGLKKKVPEREVKKAKVIPHDLLVQVMQHMERNYKVNRSMMKLRDMALIGNMYLLGLRGCDLYD